MSTRNNWKKSQDFRLSPRKVPLQLLKQRYKADALSEVLKKVLIKQLNNP